MLTSPSIKIPYQSVIKKRARIHYEYHSRWWFQPVWKILVKLNHFSKLGVKIKNLWNHHPVFCFIHQTRQTTKTNTEALTAISLPSDCLTLLGAPNCSLYLFSGVVTPQNGVMAPYLGFWAHFVGFQHLSIALYEGHLEQSNRSSTWRRRSSPPFRDQCLTVTASYNAGEQTRACFRMFRRPLSKWQKLCKNQEEGVLQMFSFVLRRGKALVTYIKALHQ